MRLDTQILEKALKDALDALETRFKAELGGIYESPFSVPRIRIMVYWSESRKCWVVRVDNEYDNLERVKVKDENEAMDKIVEVLQNIPYEAKVTLEFPPGFVWDNSPIYLVIWKPWIKKPRIIHYF